MEIRPLTRDDYEASLCLIAEFAEESLGEYGTYIDPKKLQETFDKGYLTSFGGFVDGKMVGVFGGQIVTDLCSRHPAYQEMIWFMNKDYRRHGLKLLFKAMDWCKSQGITRMIMVCMHNSKTEKIFDLYERLGFKPMETHFVKEIE